MNSSSRTNEQSNASKRRSNSGIFSKTNKLGVKVLYNELVKLCIDSSWEMFIKIIWWTISNVQELLSEMQMEVFHPKSYQADDNWPHCQVSIYVNELFLPNTVLLSLFLYQHEPGDFHFNRCIGKSNCAMHQCNLLGPLSQPSITPNPQHSLPGILARYEAINEQEVCTQNHPKKC